MANNCSNDNPCKVELNLDDCRQVFEVALPKEESDCKPTIPIEKKEEKSKAPSIPFSGYIKTSSHTTPASQSIIDTLTHPTRPPKKTFTWIRNRRPRYSKPVGIKVNNDLNRVLNIKPIIQVGPLLPNFPFIIMISPNLTIATSDERDASSLPGLATSAVMLDDIRSYLAGLGVDEGYNTYGSAGNYGGGGVWGI